MKSVGSNFPILFSSSSSSHALKWMMFLKIVIGIDCEEIIPVNRRGNDIAIDTRNVDTGVKSTRSSQSYESSSITGIAILPIQTSRHELPFKIRFHYV